MNVYFEELAEPQRAGGIDAVTRELVAHLRATGVNVSRSSEQEAIGLPDCVHLHGIWAPQLVRRFQVWGRRGVPCVVSPHGMLAPWALSHKRFKKRIAWHFYQKRLLNRAALLHGTSKHETSQFNKLQLRSPMALIPWGVSVPSARAERLVHPRLRTALFVGRIYPVKGLPMLVEAWAKVRPSGWKMKIVGPDEAGHRAAVESLVRKAKLEADFDFTGPLQAEALRDAYESAGLFIQPSYTENFGMAIAEAMSHSLPVVTTTEAPWSILPERGCGWWVAPTVDHIAQVLSTATALDDETLRAMGNRSRELVLSEFSWPQAANKMKQAYQWVLGSGPKPEFVCTEVGLRQK
ncbi:MAG: glycosyltransferase [Verrucomicrobia bacterium]|nr:glycosyltransferase [Verrucomicrobiota bacterium]